MPQTKTVTVYNFDELSETAKQNVIEKFSDINTDSDNWSEFVIEDTKQIGEILGFTITKVYFSGFWNQGDGACFEGSYKYKAGFLTALKEYAPEDKTLHNIAERLAELQRRHFYGIVANLRHFGRYYHENSVTIDVETAKSGQISEKDAEEFEDICRDLMKWIYKTLETEFKYKSSEEQIIETIRANSYVFGENGEFPVTIR